MHLLDQASAVRRCACSRCLGRCSVFEVETSKDHASVVEAGGARLVNSDLADFSLVVPDPSGLVAGAGHESAVGGVQIDVRYHVGVANERAQNVVVMKAPVHNAF